MVLVEVAMTSVVQLGRHLRPIEEQWLVQKVGKRLHYTHRSIGGEGWIAKCEIKNYDDLSAGKLTWYLYFEDDKLASYFVLKFL